MKHAKKDKGLPKGAVTSAHCEYVVNGERCNRANTQLYVWQHGETLTVCKKHFAELLYGLSTPVEGVDYDRQR